MKNMFRVAVLVESSSSYGRGLCRGIGLFAQEHPDWHLTYTPMTLGKSWPRWFKGWHGNGILTRIADPVLLPEVQAKRVPFVDFFDKGHLNLPHALAIDSTLAAEMAADFFMTAGLRHFAFCGDPGVYYSEWRAKMFAEHLQRRGLSCALYGTATAASRQHVNASYDDANYEREMKKIATWLRPLPKPLAVLACNDVRGVQIVNACWTFGLRVPDEVVVMGSGDDEVLCNLCTPPLSSIKPDCERMGYWGAQHLDNLMRGRHPKPLVDAIPPLGITERASTDLIAVNHPVVTEVLRRIRRGLHLGLAIKEVAAEFGVTRRCLDGLFVQHIGATANEVVQRERLRRARLLLQEGRRSVTAVARAAGFHSSAQLIANFRRHFGVTPVRSKLVKYRHACSTNRHSYYNLHPCMISL